MDVCRENENIVSDTLSTKIIDINQPSTSRVVSKLGSCEVCGNVSAKYTCPKCEVKTCSLRCSQIHKAELECDGNRDKTKFIPINKFSNLDLSSDYRLLEEITRSVETLKKNRGKRPVRPGPHSDLPNHLIKLRKATMARKTILKFLPKDFTRRKQNTTYLHFASNVVFWHLELIFANADCLKLTEDKIPESTKLSNVLHKYLVKQEDKLMQEKLQYYQAVDLPGIKLLLKAEQKVGCKFYELDPLATLKDNLKNRIIIEYPIIHVVLKEHADLYDILDSDGEEDEMDIDVKNTNGEAVVNRIIKKAEEEETLDNSLKNLLFISENSDGEGSDPE